MNFFLTRRLPLATMVFVAMASSLPAAAPVAGTPATAPVVVAQTTGRMTVPLLFRNNTELSVKDAGTNGSAERHTFPSFHQSWQLPKTGEGSIYFKLSPQRVNDTIDAAFVLFSPGQGIATAATAGLENDNFWMELFSKGNRRTYIRVGLPSRKTFEKFTDRSISWLKKNVSCNVLIHYHAGDKKILVYLQEASSTTNPWVEYENYSNNNIPNNARYFSLSNWGVGLKYSDIRVGEHPKEYMNKLQAADRGVTDLILALCSTTPATATNAYLQATAPTTVTGSSTTVPYYQTLITALQEANDALSAFNSNPTPTFSREAGGNWGAAMNNTALYPRPTIPADVTLPTGVSLSPHFYVDPAVNPVHPDAAALIRAMTNPTLQQTVITAHQTSAQALQTIDGQVTQLIRQLASPTTSASALRDALILGAPNGLTNAAFSATIPYFKNLITALQAANDTLRNKPMPQAIASAFSRPNFSDISATGTSAPNPYATIATSLSPTLYNAAAQHPDGIALSNAVNLALALALQATNAAVTGLMGQLNDPAQQATALATATAVQSNGQTYAQLIASYLQNANNTMAGYADAQALARAAVGSTLYVDGATQQPTLFASTANAHPDSVALANAVTTARSVVAITNTTLAEALQRADNNVIALIAQITNTATRSTGLSIANRPNTNGIAYYLSLSEALQNANNALAGNAAAIAIANAYPRSLPTVAGITLARSLYVDGATAPQHPDAAALRAAVNNAVSGGVQLIPALPETNSTQQPIPGTTGVNVVIQEAEPVPNPDGTVDL